MRLTDSDSENHCCSKSSRIQWEKISVVYLCRNYGIFGSAIIKTYITKNFVQHTPLHLDHPQPLVLVFQELAIKQFKIFVWPKNLHKIPLDVSCDKWTFSMQRKCSNVELHPNVEPLTIATNTICRLDRCACVVPYSTK